MFSWSSANSIWYKYTLQIQPIYLENSFHWREIFLSNTKYTGEISINQEWRCNECNNVWFRTEGHMDAHRRTQKTDVLTDTDRNMWGHTQPAVRTAHRLTYVRTLTHTNRPTCVRIHRTTDVRTCIQTDVGTHTHTRLRRTAHFYNKTWMGSVHSWPLWAEISNSALTSGLNILQYILQ